MPEEIREKNPRGKFRVAIGNIDEIVDIYLDHRFPLADEILRKTAEKFNSIQIEK